MSYRRFNLLTESAATVATAAGGDLETSNSPPARNAANAASAARGELKTELPPIGDVLLMFERAVVRLMELGRLRAEAEREALSIVSAKLRNDPRLAPEQTDPHRCLICGAGGTLLPFLSAAPGHHHWMHSDECWAEHCRRQSEKVEACLRAAGLMDAQAA